MYYRSIIQATRVKGRVIKGDELTLLQMKLMMYTSLQIEVLDNSETEYILDAVQLIKMIEPEIKESSINYQYLDMEKSLQKLTTMGIEVLERTDEGAISKNIIKVPYILSLESFPNNKTFSVRLHDELLLLYNDPFTYIDNV